MTRAGLKWRTRPPDKKKLLAIGALVVAALIARFFSPWLARLFDRLVNGDSGRGNRVGFFLAIASVSLACVFASVAGRLWRSSTVLYRIAGGLAGAAAMISLVPLFFGLPGRGPRTASEQAFDRALPGVHDGMIVGLLVSLVAGFPLYLYLADFWRRRSEGDQP